MIQLTLTLKMTTAQVVETSVTVNNNSPIQDYVHPDESIFLSRVEGSMSRARVTFFFSNFFFLEKVIIDTINVIKTNKKNLKNKWRVKNF